MMSDFTMTRFASTSPATGVAGPGRLIPLLRTVLRTYLTRRALPELTPRELADVGLSSVAAVAEAARLPWDAIPGPRRSGSGIMSRIQCALERARTRRLISRLEAREFRDLGVSPSDAQSEATKPFWRV
jgi:uncharacterized protein YjiS (DUF1127 family)